MIRRLIRRLTAHRRSSHAGATIGYAKELHSLAAQPGYLSELEQTLQTWARTTTRRDAVLLRKIEHRALEGLDKLWLDTCAALHLDPIDIEWAQLSTGELITV